MNRHLLFVVASTLLFAGTGCSKGDGGSQEEINPAAQAEAAKIFMERCSTCHGLNGAGDGQGAAALNPKPRNFQDKDWQTSVTDEHIEKIIKEGGRKPWARAPQCRRTPTSSRTPPS